MRPLGETVGWDLHWSGRSAFSRSTELRSGGVVLATLRWRGFLGVRAEGETAEGRFSLRRLGVLGRSVRVEGPAGTAVAMLRRSLLPRGGTIQLGTRRYRLVREGFLGRSWRVENESGEALLRLRRRFAWFRAAASLEVLAPAAGLSDAGPLALIAWHQLVEAVRSSQRAGG